MHIALWGESVLTRSSYVPFYLCLALSLVVIPVACDEMPINLVQAQRTYKQIRRERDQLFTPLRAALKNSAQEASKQDETQKNALGPDHHALIDATEARELDLPLLADTLDHAQTMLGRWAIKDSTETVSTKKMVCARQKLIKELVKKEELLRDMCTALVPLAKSEDALCAYWVSNDLFSSAKYLYFNPIHIPLLCNIPGVKKVFSKLCDVLNNRRVTLEGAWAVDAFKGASYVAAVMGVRNVFEELFFASIGCGRAGGTNLDVAFLDGIKQPFNAFNPTPYLFSGRQLYNPGERRGQYNYSQRAFTDSTRFGSMHDCYYAFAHGMDEREAENLKIKGSFSFINRLSNWTHKKEVDPGFWRKFQAGSAAGGRGLASLVSLAFSYATLRPLWLRLWVTMNGLHLRMNKVADAICAMKMVTQAVVETGLFEDEALVNRARDLLHQLEKGELKEIYKLFSAETFKTESSVFYMRGKVLHAHRELEKAKDKLLPLMRLVGEVDAYCSVASLMVAHKDHNARYCFVEFDAGAKPVIELREFWTPLLESDLVFLLPEGVVTNDIKIGGSTPRNVLFTGPNGGGKSTVLKAVGHAVILAHSWGIVPAMHARMSFFDGMRCCLDPREDISKGISTFMASKRGMERLYEFTRNNAAPRKIITLIDEPYAGTVDDEMARRTGQFCGDIAAVGNGLAVIATHVKPQFKTGADFGFYHVGIADDGKGGFVRTYKVQPGLCNWWFNDAARRRRYIDWLNPTPGEKKDNGGMPAT